MNRTVINKTEGTIRVVMVMPGTWDLLLRQMVGGGPTTVGFVGPGETFVVPPELDHLPIMVETPAYLCSRTTVELDPSVFGK